MKIAFCDNSLRELLNFRGDVIDHFVENGNSVILIAPYNLKNEKINNSVKIYPIKLERSGMNPFQDIKYMINLIRIYYKEKPDIIFHYTIKPNIYGSVAARINGIPSVTTITGLGYAFFHAGIKSKIARMLYRVAMKLPKKIFVLNETNMKILIKNNIVPKDKIILLPGGEGINLDLYK